MDETTVLNLINPGAILTFDHAPGRRWIVERIVPLTDPRLRPEAYVFSRLLDPNGIGVSEYEERVYRSYLVNRVAVEGTAGIASAVPLR